MSTTYRHTQRNPLVIALLVTVWMTVFLATVRFPHPILIATTVFFGVLLLVFSSLTVELRDGELHVAFGVGLIRRRIPLSRIRKIQAVRNHWYYGWGIRLTPHGWLWCVSGLGAVELTFDDGHRFRIGSDEPGALALALQQESIGQMSAAPGAHD